MTHTPPEYTPRELSEKCPATEQYISLLKSIIAIEQHSLNKAKARLEALIKCDYATAFEVEHYAKSVVDSLKEIEKQNDKITALENGTYHRLFR